MCLCVRERERDKEKETKQKRTEGGEKISFRNYKEQSSL